jgi:hypothetical protein
MGAEAVGVRLGKFSPSGAMEQAKLTAPRVKTNKAPGFINRSHSFLSLNFILNPATFPGFNHHVISHKIAIIFSA